MGKHDRKKTPVVLPLVCFGFAIIIACDTCAIDLGRLSDLGVNYPSWLHLMPIAVPGICGLIWLWVRKTHYWLGWILPVMVCYTLIFAVPSYVNRRVARIRVTRMLTPSEIQSLEGSLGFRVHHEGWGAGEFIFVAPENEQRARDELSQMNLVP